MFMYAYESGFCLCVCLCVSRSTRQSDGGLVGPNEKTLQSSSRMIKCLQKCNKVLEQLCSRGEGEECATVGDGCYFWLVEGKLQKDNSFWEPFKDTSWNIVMIAHQKMGKPSGRL